MSALDLTLAELDAYPDRESLVDEYVARAASICGIPVPSWRWTSGNRGRASNAKYEVTIPSWVGAPASFDPGHRTPLFLAYYAMHEVCHLPDDSWGHGERFKQYERQALAAFGVGIRYMRHYPAVLFDLETREEPYISHKEHRRRRLVELRRVRRAVAAGERVEGG